MGKTHAATNTYLRWAASQAAVPSRLTSRQSTSLTNSYARFTCNISRWKCVTVSECTKIQEMKPRSPRKAGEHADLVHRSDLSTMSLRIRLRLSGRCSSRTQNSSDDDTKLFMLPEVQRCIKQDISGDKNASTNFLNAFIWTRRPSSFLCKGITFHINLTGSSRFFFEMSRSRVMNLEVHAMISGF